MRWFTTLFGATTLATTATLSGFFLGLVAGSRTFGERSKRWRRPVRAFRDPRDRRRTGSAARPSDPRSLPPGVSRPLPALSPFPAGFALVKLLLALAAIGIPTFCMGGTLPALGQAIACLRSAPRNPRRRPVRDQPARRDLGHAGGSLRPPSTSRPGRELRVRGGRNLGRRPDGVPHRVCDSAGALSESALNRLGRVAQTVRRGRVVLVLSACPDSARSRSRCCGRACSPLSTRTRCIRSPSWCSSSCWV